MDDFVVNAEEEQEADDIVTGMDTTCTRYNMDNGYDKIKIMPNNHDDFQRDKKDQRLEEVNNFKYLGSVIS